MRTTSHPGVPVANEVILPIAGRLDPLGAPERTREVLADSAGFGATNAYPRFERHSLGHYLECLDTIAALHDPGGEINN